MSPLEGKNDSSRQPGNSVEHAEHVVEAFLSSEPLQSSVEDDEATLSDCVEAEAINSTPLAHDVEDRMPIDVLRSEFVPLDDNALSQILHYAPPTPSIQCIGGIEEEKAEVSSLADTLTCAYAMEEDVAPSGEALVIGAAGLPEDSIALDEAYARLLAAEEEEAHALAMKGISRDEWLGGPVTPLIDHHSVASLHTVRPACTGGQSLFRGAEATVVSISDEELHPSEITEDAAIHAEFLGEDSTISGAHPSAALPADEESAQLATVVDDSDTAEATVIDSVPIATDKMGVASVIEDGMGDVVGGKPPRRELSPREGGFDAIADEVAAVINIEEDYHPAEYSDDDAEAEAELVGTDDVYDASALHRLRGALAADHLANQDTAAEEYVDHGITVESIALLSEEHACDLQGNYSESQVQATLVNAWETDADEPVDVPTPVSACLEEQSYLREQSSTPPLPPEKPSPPSGANFRPVTSEVHPTAPLYDETSSQPSASAHHEDSEVPDWLRDPPAQEAFSSGSRNDSAGAWSSSVSSDLSSLASSHRVIALTNNLARGTNHVMDLLFGDTKPPFVNRRGRSTTENATEAVASRTLLPWSVIHSPATGMWVATLQTNQKALDSNNVELASKSLRAFSLPTEKQATCLAKAWTPPRMHRFSDYSHCHVCRAKFAVFRRACHCRNCGVCICKECSVLWPSRMLPDMYNFKREGNVNVCTSCDWLCSSFRLALLEGNHDLAVALYETGNINLHEPFANVKGELFFPVHCAVLGQNLDLLRWLVDEHCCPIKSVRVSGKTKDSVAKYTPIVTSRGRSLLGIAMQYQNIQIVRYLVVEKGISIAGEKDITPELLVLNLDAVLRLLPEDAIRRSPSAPHEDVAETNQFSTSDSNLSPQLPVRDVNVRTVSVDARDFGAINHSRNNEQWLEDDMESHGDECIICFDSKIDCVATPCGHQICCLKCSEHISRCPVCASDCSFLRVFRP